MAAKSGLVGMKGYFKTYNLVKYFLPHLHCFLNETIFYAKLLGWFLGSEVTWFIASKFDTNIQLILKLLSKFHVARPNRFQVISKSLKV